MQDSDKKHHVKNGFINPYVQKETSNIKHWGALRWAKKMRTIDKNRATNISIKKPNLDAINIPGDQPQITWIGHSSILIQHKGINILTDPVISDRIGPIKLPAISIKRITQSALSIDELPKIDAVVISHNHYDHLDKQTVRKIGNKPLWIVPLNLKKWFINQGITNVVELDWWQQHKQDTMTFTCTPTQHWSGRSPFVNPNGVPDTLWSSWAINIDGWKFWFGGDTGYNDVQFTEIGDRLGPFDASAIPIGAYLPQWFQKYHVSPAQAIQIHQNIKSKWSFGIHWGCFVLSLEAVDQPPIDLAIAKKSAGLADDAFETLALGETRIVVRD